MLVCRKMWCLWVFLMCSMVIPIFGLPPNGENGRNLAGSMTGTQGAQYFRSAITQQNMQTILSVIEERLRGLDGVYAARGAAVQQLDTCTRRLDAIEGKIDRLESVISLRLDKLSEAVNARSLKEQLSAEHVGRTYDNLQHRIDMTSVKLQTIFESGLSRVERSQMQVAATAGWTTATGRATSAMTMATVDNTTVNAIKDAIVKPIIDQISQSSASLNASVREVIAQQQQNDQTAANEGQAQTVVKATIAREANNIANKMTTMYVELWRRGQALESLAKDGMAVANATRREYQDGLRAIMMQLNGRRHYQLQQQQIQQQQQTQQHSSNESTLEQSMDALGSMIQRKMTDISRKMDSKFEEVITAQTLFMETCHQIQLNEPQLESELHTILESLYNRFVNITVTTYSELQVIQELVKSRNSQVSKSVSHLSNAMTQLDQRQHDTIKTIMRMINDVRNSNGGTGISHGIRGNYIKPLDQRMSGILALLQEIQEQMTYAEIQRDEMEKNNTNSIIAQVAKQINTAVANITNLKLTKDTPKEKQDELFSLIGKLIDMTNKVDELIIKLESRINSFDKNFETQFVDDDNDIDDFYESELTNITSPTELINKLRNIKTEGTKNRNNRLEEKEEKSYDDISDLADKEMSLSDFDYVIDYNNHTDNLENKQIKLNNFNHKNVDRNRIRHSHEHNHPFDRGPLEKPEHIDTFENGNQTDTDYIELSNPDYEDDIEYPIGKSVKTKVN